LRKFLREEKEYSRNSRARHRHPDTGQAGEEGDAMSTEWINDKPFQHTSRGGCVFTANRCDFHGGVIIYAPSEASGEQLYSDLAEMIGYHATVIHPRLNGFAGYDCIKFIPGVKLEMDGTVAGGEGKRGRGA
jgi:hypothetical protein